MVENKKNRQKRPSGFGKDELKLMKKMFGGAPVFICLLEGPEHRLQHINTEFRKLYGNRPFSTGRTVRELWPELKGQGARGMDLFDALDHIYATGEPFIANEFEAYIDRTNTGKLEKGYFNFVNQPLKNDDGEVYGIFVSGYEVTERVEARKAKALSENRLRVVLEGASVGLWEVDAKNKTMIFMSDQFKTQYGRSAEETLTYEDIFEAMHPDDLPHVEEKIKEAVEESVFYEVEYRVFWPDGSLHWIMVRGQSILDKEGRPDRRIGITIDITQLKEAERQLEEAVKVRDDFLSIASHELQTPVTGLKTRTDLFKRQLQDTGNKRYIRQAGKISNQINQLSKLTGNLLDISRIQKGRLRLEKEIFFLDGLIKETVDSLQHISHHTIKIHGETKKKIYADRFRIGQVLTNFLENAIKYSPEADEVIVRFSQDAGKATVSVTDFGIGVSKNDRQKIFERFFKGGDGSKKTFPGFGIGLYISSQIIERHGGAIWVEDNKGRGSVFLFTLPATTPE